MATSDQDHNQFRKYDIELDQIPRLDADDPAIDELILQNVSYQFFFKTYHSHSFYLLNKIK